MTREGQRHHSFKVECSHTCFIVNMETIANQTGSTPPWDRVKVSARIDSARSTDINYALSLESAAFGDGCMLLMCGNEDKVAIMDANTYGGLHSHHRHRLPRHAANRPLCLCNVRVNPTWTDTIGSHRENWFGFKKWSIASGKGNPEEIRVIDGQLYAHRLPPLPDRPHNRRHCPRHLPFRPVGNSPIPTRWCVRAHLVSYTHYDAQGYGTNCGIAAYTLEDSPSTDSAIDHMSGDGIIDLSPDGKHVVLSLCLGGRRTLVWTRKQAFTAWTWLPYRLTLLPYAPDMDFYGFNVDPSTGNIYTANVNGFVTNSMISILTARANYCKMTWWLELHLPILFQIKHFLATFSRQNQVNHSAKAWQHHHQALAQKNFEEYSVPPPTEIWRPR